MDSRELDARIAIEFLGWHNVQMETVGNNRVLRGWKPPAYTVRTGIPYYSTDPKASSLVLDEIKRRGWEWKWENRLVALNDSKRYRFEIQVYADDGTFVTTRDLVYAWSDNRYRVVCLAALQATESE